MTEKENKAEVVDLPLKGSKCPSCGAETVLRFRPFCSKRCADVDLGRWLNEAYVVAGPAIDEEALAEEAEKLTDAKKD